MFANKFISEKASTGISQYKLKQIITSFRKWVYRITQETVSQKHDGKLLKFWTHFCD